MSMVRANEPLLQNELILKADNVKRTYGSGRAAVHALIDVNLAIRFGQLVVLKGRSGSGKTTLINLLGALDQPTEGDIYFCGEQLASKSERKRNEIRRTEMGLIFQSFALVPIMSAYENVEFGLRIARVPAKERKEKAIEALDTVGLKPRMHHRPFELSGGEQQRVAIARAIAHRPKLILADEPTAELDSRTGLMVIQLFKELVRTAGMTIVLTTHDPAVMELADVVYELEDGKIADLSK